MIAMLAAMPTSEQRAAEAVRAALRVIEEVAVPEDLRAVAFERTFIALVDGVPDTQEASGSNPAQLAGSRAGSAAGRLAAKLAVDSKLVERVLDFDDDGVHITVTRTRLAKQKSAAIHQIATLVVAGRQGAGLEEWTSQSVVRQATEAHGVEDPSNFGSYMKKLDGIRARGSGRTGELKMNAVGYEAAARLIQQLVGDDAP